MADKKDFKFPYPYNFVSLGDGNNINRKSVEKGNYTGKIYCKLENLTPIFTAKSGNDDKNSNHKVEEFLNDGKNYILPASSIKGEIKNVIEVLTTSCIKNVGEERLEKRLKAGEKSKNFKFGIIRSLPDEKSNGKIEESEKIKISIKLLRNSPKIVKNKELAGGFYPIKVNNNIYKYASQGTKNDKSINDSQILEEVTNGGTINGVLWISSTIFKKKYEKIIVPKNSKEIYEFSSDKYKDLEYLINQRQDRERKMGKEFYIDKIEVGDPIIMEVKNTKVENLAFSEIPRLRYKYSPYDLIPEKFKPCQSADNLCFACRMFGMIAKEQSESGKNAVAGRVYFSDATVDMKKAKIEKKPVLIKPLGEPHPSLREFYLLYDDDSKEIDAQIRGRKFYWHHTDKINKDWKDYYKSICAPKEAKYNSSIQLMNPHNEFTFEVSFENLTKEELGVLIYALELEEGLLHKFGKGKALGFGSSKVKIDKILLNSQNRYSSFTANYTEIDKKEFIDEAKKNYLIETKNEIKELKCILSAVNNLDFSKSPFPEAKNGKGEVNTLNWFTVHKKEKGFKLPKLSEYIKK